jgi:hypothetical protein
MSVPDSIPGVLYPVVALNHLSGYDTLSVTLQAAPFSTVFTAHNQNESTVGTILDGARDKSYNALSSIFSNVDTLEKGNLASAFDQLSPNQQQGVVSAGHIGLNLLSATIAQRLAALRMAHSEGVSGANVSLNGADALTLGMDQSAGPNSALVQSAFARAAAPTGAPATGSPVAVTPAMGGVPNLGGFVMATALSGSADYGGQNKSVTGYLVMAGVDTVVGNNVVLGGAFSLSEADSDLPWATGKTKLRTYQGTLYGSWSGDNMFVDGFAGWGAASASAIRFGNVGGTVYGAHSSPDGSQGMVGLSAGTVIQAASWARVMPMGGIEWDAFHTNAYTETGSVIAMHVGASDADVLIARLGGEAVGDFKLDNGGVVHPHVRAFLAHALGNGGSNFAGAFNAAPTSSGAFHYRDAGNWAELGAGVDARIGTGTTIGINYDATLGRRDGSFGAVTGRIRITF